MRGCGDVVVGEHLAIGAGRADVDFVDRLKVEEERDAPAIDQLAV